MFYTLEASAKPETNGNYPQITLADFSKEQYIFDLRINDFWDKQTKLDCFKLNNGFIPTDFCTISHINCASGIVVSEKVKMKFDILLSQGCNFSPHKYFPLLMPGLPDLKRYYFMQILGTNDIVDYKHTIFENQLTDEEVCIDSHDQYKIEFYPITIHLNKPMDLFKHPYDGDLFISERLKNIIEGSDLVGYAEIMRFEGYKLTANSM